MWLLRGWASLSLTAEAWAISSREPASFVPALPGHFASLGDVVPRGLDFNEVRVRISHLSSFSERGYRTSLPSGMPSYRATSSSSRSPFRLGGGSAHEKKRSYFAQKLQEGEPEYEGTSGDFSSGNSINVGENRSSDPIAGQTAKPPRRPCGDREQQSTQKSLTKDAGEPVEQEKLSGRSTWHPREMQIESDSDSRGGSDEGAGAATSLLSWIRPPWLKAQKGLGAKRGQPNNTVAVKPRAAKKAPANSNKEQTKDNSERLVSAPPQSSGVATSNQSDSRGIAKAMPPGSSVQLSSTQPADTVAAAKRLDQDGEEGDQDMKKKKLPILKLVGWPWSSGDTSTSSSPSATEAVVVAQESEGEKLAQQDISSPLSLPSSPEVCAVPQGQLTNNSWFPFWGGGESESTNKQNKQGLRKDGNGGIFAVELESPTSGTPPLSNGTSFDGAVATKDSSTPPAAPRLSRWLRSAVGKPFSVLGRPFRAAVRASLIRAEDSPSTSSAGIPRAPLPVLPLPPATRALQQILTEDANLYFPVRAPWRPLLYRWGYSLLSKNKGNDARVAENMQQAEVLSFPEGSSSSTVLAEGNGDNEIMLDTGVGAKVDSREIRIRGKLSGLASDIVSRLRLLDGRLRLGKSEVETETTVEKVPEYNRNRVGKWASVRLKEVPDSGEEADPYLWRRGSDPTRWLTGATMFVGADAALYRPAMSQVSEVLPAIADDEEAQPKPQELKKCQEEREESEDKSALCSASEDTSNPIAPMTQKNPSPTLLSEAGVKATYFFTVLRPARLLVSGFLGKILRVMRRAKLWMLLRRNSMPRAEPLLPGVETGISTLSVPLTSTEMLSPPLTRKGKMPPSSIKKIAGAKSVETAAAVTKPGAKLLLNRGSNSSEVSAPEAVGQGGWDLFGFFPEDEEEELQSSSAVAEPYAASIAKEAVVEVGRWDAVAAAGVATEPSENVTPAVDEQGVLLWPLSAWAEGLDPRAQVGFSFWSLADFGVGIFHSQGVLSHVVVCNTYIATFN